MLCGQLLYKEYLTEFPTVSQGKGGNRQIEKDKFVLLANDIGSDTDLSKFKDRDDARKALKKKARKSTGLIQYFILRAIIGWIIEKILSYYFVQK
jgi:hypothetical protein